MYVGLEVEVVFPEIVLFVTVTVPLAQLYTPPPFEFPEIVVFVIVNVALFQLIIPKVAFSEIVQFAIVRVLLLVW